MRKYSGPKERFDAAMDISTGIDDLFELSKSEYNFVKSAVAENPNTTPQILESLIPQKLKVEDDYIVLASVLKSRNVPSYLSDKIVDLFLEGGSKIEPRDYYPTMAVKNLFNNTSISYESLCRLLCSNNFPNFMKLKIASFETRKDILMYLENDKSEKVRKKAKKTLSNLPEKVIAFTD